MRGRPVEMSVRKTPTILEKNTRSLKHVLAVGNPVLASNSLYVAYISPGDGRNDTWALLASIDGKQVAFPSSMTGDNWYNFQVIKSDPVKPNNDNVQSTLDFFFKGWRNWPYVKEVAIALEAMGYTVP